MDELEQIRRQRMEKLQSEQQAHAQAAQQIKQAEGLVKQVMTKEALQRYGTVKLAHPDVALAALQAMLQAIQSGIRKIDEPTLKKVLQQLSPKRHEIKISRK